MAVRADGRRLALALATVYVIWGSTYLAIRVAVETLPPFLMAGARFMVAGALLLAFAIRRGDVRGDRVGWRQWRAAAIVGGLLLLGGNGGVVWAEQRVASGVAALIVATVPIWMALFAARRDREAVRTRAAIGLALGFAGTVILSRTSGEGGGAVNLAGTLALVFASISWAFGSVLAPRLSLPKRPMVTTGMEMLAGGALLTLAGIVTGEVGDVRFEAFSRASLIAFAYLIVAGSLAGFSAYSWLLHNTSPQIASTYAYVNPMIAVFLGWAILSEPISGMTVLAAALIIGAVALIVRSASARGAEPPVPAPIEAPAVADERASG
jgi:drug/metabolite transporter (DMT)-like permease